ncbi:hypothetical protein MHSWG343_05540 [Candidatus Mycoplasma haematohominis]|uniref:Uncharacterized protein n=1 Tax=Candidatus Mycoplasma haematohominis TaxID=1494318 RepID=A0A478FQZ5_9MOLU|nr:hypothetical protein MHSWG343_05540 [Candidatus Mycoplasma haemohominis]
MNKACEIALKKEKTHFSSNSKYENDMWNYCSVFIVKPVTIENSKKKEKYEENTFGVEKTHNFISTQDLRNEFFWRVRNEEFFSESGDKSGNTATANSFFKSFYDDNKNKPDNRSNIKDQCEAAYKKSSTWNNDLTLANVKQYCSFDVIPA